MNLFNLMREMVEEGYHITIYSRQNLWSCKISEKAFGKTLSHVDKPSPEEAIRCAYLELNPIPRSGAI